MPSSFPSRRWAAVSLVGLLLVASLPSPVTASDTTEIMSAKLPSPRDGTAAVGLGDHVYIFGGDSGTRSDQILRYDAVNDTLEVLPVTLPRSMSGLSAARAGDAIYLFGGWGSPYSDQVFRFDPANETLDIMGATLPSGRTYTSAVGAGDHIYVFGGTLNCSPCTTNEILRYDPETDTVATMAATLPTRRTGTSAIWDGESAYIFGGHTVSNDERFDQIVRYDPETDTVTVLAATLPNPRTHTSAVYAGGQAHIFGGTPCGNPGTKCDAIVNFDPASGSVTVNETRLSTGRYLTSAAVADRSAFIIGGYDGARSDQILRHGPVAHNHPPVLDPIANQTLVATEPYTLQITAQDPDDEVLTLTLGPLPAGADFTDHGNGTGTFEWTPTRGQIANFTLEATAADRYDSTNLTIHLSVLPPPDRPLVLDPIPDQTVLAEDLLVVPVTASDPDDDPITLSAQGLPTGAAFTDHGDGTGTFDWTPDRSQIGNHTVQIDASANGTTTNRTFEIQVDEPPNTPPVVAAIDDREVVAEEVVVVNVAASDPDGDPIALTLAPIPANATFTDHGDGTGTFVWNTTWDDLGVHTLTVTADDGNGTGDRAFTVNVTKGPPPDIVPIPDQTAEEGTLFILDVAATDPDDGTIVLGLHPMPSGANLTDHGDGTGTFFWNITYDDAGTYTFTVTASNVNATAEETFQLQVFNVDRPPVFTLLEPTHRIAHHMSLTVPIEATDPDGDPISFSVTGLPTGATFTDHGDDTATFSWADGDPLGTHSMMVLATAAGATVEAPLTIEVVPLYDFRLVEPQPKLHARGSPGELLNFSFGVRNTGYLDHDVRFTATDISSAQEGFSLGVPGPVTVTSGQTETLHLTVLVPEDGSHARIRLNAHSESDPGMPTRLLTWLLDIPVHIEIALEDDAPSVANDTALLGFRGNVTLTWENGAPATGIPFQAHHRYLGIDRATLEATTDDNGTWTFSGMEDPFLGLVGDHELEVEVTRGVRTDLETRAWETIVIDPGL